LKHVHRCWRWNPGPERDPANTFARATGQGLGFETLVPPPLVGHDLGSAKPTRPGVEGRWKAADQAYANQSF
jgi:hypothetical protein